LQYLSGAFVFKEFYAEFHVTPGKLCTKQDADPPDYDDEDKQGCKIDLGLQFQSPFSGDLFC